ncbi:MAG: hypothetical protein RIT81_27660 [Deltaproteobacteria bacterium]
MKQSSRTISTGLVALLAACSSPDGRQLVVHVRTTLDAEALGDVQVDLDVGGERRDGVLLTRSEDDDGALGSFGVVPSEGASEVRLRFAEAEGAFEHVARFDDFVAGERTFVFVCLDPVTACAGACDAERLEAGVPPRGWDDCGPTADVATTPGEDGDPMSVGDRRVAAIGGAGDQHVTGLVRVDATRDVVVGRFSGTIDLGGEREADGEDGFVAALGGGGGTAWWLWLTGPGDEAVNAVASLEDGATTVVGTFEQRLDVTGPSGVVASFDARGGTDVFVLVVDGAGAVVAERSFGSGVDDRATDVAVGLERGAYRIAVAGAQRGPVDLEDGCPWAGNVQFGVTSGVDRALAVVFDPELACLRGATIAGGDEVVADAVVVHGGGHVVTAARTLGAVEMPLSLADRRPPIAAPVDGEADALLFELSPNGDVSNLVEIAGAGNDQVEVLSAPPTQGRLLVSGTFGPGPRGYGVAGAIGAPDRRIFAMYLTTGPLHPEWVKDVAVDAALVPTAGASSIGVSATIVASFTAAFEIDGTPVVPPVGEAGVVAMQFDMEGVLTATELLVAGQATATAYRNDASGVTIAGAYSGAVDVEGLGRADGVDGFVIRR